MWHLKITQVGNIESSRLWFKFIIGMHSIKFCLNTEFINVFRDKKAFIYPLNIFVWLVRRHTLNRPGPPFKEESDALKTPMSESEFEDGSFCLVARTLTTRQACGQIL